MVLLDGQKWLADVGGADCTSAWPLPLSDTQPDGHVRLHRGELPHGNPGWGVQVLCHTCMLPKAVPCVASSDIAGVGGADCTSSRPLPLHDAQLKGHVCRHRGELPPGNPGCVEVCWHVWRAKLASCTCMSQAV